MRHRGRPAVKLERGRKRCRRIETSQRDQHELRYSYSIQETAVYVQKESSSAPERGALAPAISPFQLPPWRLAHNRLLYRRIPPCSFIFRWFLHCRRRTAGSLVRHSSAAFMVPFRWPVYITIPSNPSRLSARFFSIS